MEFQEGDEVLLRVSPTKGVVRFGTKRKLSPRYIGPFVNKEWVSKSAYRLEQPDSIRRVHDVFCVSMLKKVLELRDPEHHIIVEPVNTEQELSFETRPIRILDTSERVLRCKTFKYVKILWSNQWSVKQHGSLSRICMRNILNYSNLITLVRIHIIFLLLVIVTKEFEGEFC